MRPQGAEIYSGREPLDRRKYSVHRMSLVHMSAALLGLDDSVKAIEIQRRKPHVHRPLPGLWANMVEHLGSNRQDITYI